LILECRNSMFYVAELNEMPCEKEWAATIRFWFVILICEFLLDVCWKNKELRAIKDFQTTRRSSSLE
jgi:hypothetical protein